MSRPSSASGEPIELTSIIKQPDDDLYLREVRQIGLGVLGLQLVLLIVWSNMQSRRFSLTWDFSVYHQAWWLIGHGNLNPFATLNGFPFGRITENLLCGRWRY